MGWLGWEDGLLDYGYVDWSCGAGPVDGSLLGARHLGEVCGWLVDVLIDCTVWLFCCASDLVDRPEELRSLSN
jgi:hypothetical protein